MHFKALVLYTYTPAQGAHGVHAESSATGRVGEGGYDLMLS